MHFDHRDPRPRRLHGDIRRTLHAGLLLASLSMLATPAALAANAAFTVEPPLEFPHERSIGEDAYVGYAFSWSYCGGALRPADRGVFEAELRAAIRRHHPSGEWSERLIAVAHFARPAAHR